MLRKGKESQMLRSESGRAQLPHRKDTVFGGRSPQSGSAVVVMGRRLRGLVLLTARPS